jgi:hypothetical protein
VEIATDLGARESSIFFGRRLDCPNQLEMAAQISVFERRLFDPFVPNVASTNACRMRYLRGAKRTSAGQRYSDRDKRPDVHHIAGRNGSSFGHHVPASKWISRRIEEPITSDVCRAAAVAASFVKSVLSCVAYVRVGRRSSLETGNSRVSCGLAAVPVLVA